MKIVPVAPIGKRRTAAFVSGATCCGVREFELDEYPPSPNGERLRRLRIGERLEPHMTLGRVARALGIQPAELSGLETGSRTLATEEEWGRLLREVFSLRPYGLRNHSTFSDWEKSTAGQP